MMGVMRGVEAEVPAGMVVSIRTALFLGDRDEVEMTSHSSSHDDPSSMPAGEPRALVIDR